MKIAIKMTGCHNNRYELEQILRWAIDNKVSVVAEDEADYCIINTCTVTHVADKKSRQMVRKTKNARPDAKTIVFGCAARMQKEEFEKIMEVDHLVPDLEAVIALLEIELKRVGHDDDFEEIDFSRSRPMVQIQDGCDNYCTYCIIATARGKSKNHLKKKIISDIKKHVAAGYAEVVLTGINIGAYGCTNTTKAKESQFAELIESILEETKLERLRLSSLGPEFFDERLFKALKNPRVCRHIHLSIQSGSTSVLKRMHRLYDAEHVEKVIKRLKKDIPGIAITTDIIVGFPEETDEEFAETLDFVKRNPIAKAHIFPYSIRGNTLAAKMKQIPDAVKKERAKALQAVADKQRADFIKSQIGKKCTVVWEKELESGAIEGLTDHYIRVQKKGGYKIGGVTEELLSAKIIS